MAPSADGATEVRLSQTANGQPLDPVLPPPTPPVPEPGQSETRPAWATREGGSFWHNIHVTLAHGKTKGRHAPPLWLNLPWWLYLAALIVVWLAVNWCVQAYRKPSEIAALLDPLFHKNETAAWEAYGDLYETHATALMTPEFLAALAQAESRGNPLARTYWRWRWTWHPFKIFAPASSAVGLFQITDGAFERCRPYCVRGGKVAREGPWWDLQSCWLNASYNRLVPSHSIEMTSACLHVQTERILAKTKSKQAPLNVVQDLAAVIHLCGPNAGEEYARGGFKFKPGRRCGDHDPRAYIDNIRSLKKRFSRLRAE